MTKRRLWPRLLFQWARRPYTSCYSGDLVVHMVSAPRGTGIVAAMIPKKGKTQRSNPFTRMGKTHFLGIKIGRKEVKGKLNLLSRSEESNNGGNLLVELDRAIGAFTSLPNEG
ncbi:hypothetical protein E6C27_scaffold89G003670 [Cucumis melo var. makuwa]|uniref:Uncharacterized protein n=1 Tax=Cucumis melo var. makuwa TaxID=1194695 RepID=A0A5A7V8L6_CUCMM|nr:hypothetical protein E6C27_scaffold89G003670 [Cucumis melo var. makuwa]